MEIAEKDIFKRQINLPIENQKIQKINFEREKQNRKQIIANEIMRKRLYLSKSNSINNSYDLNNFFDIQKLNIDPQLKEKNYINSILNSNTYDNIFIFIKEILSTQNLNEDKLKYGLFLLNEKFGGFNDEDFNINYENLLQNNFKEIIFNILNYSKNKNKKLEENEIILDLTYAILVNFSYYTALNVNQVSFLVDDNFLNLHLFFINNTSNLFVIKNILYLLYNISLGNNEFTNNIFTYNKNQIMISFIDYINKYEDNNLNIDIILELFINYINIFSYRKNKNNKIKKQKNSVNNTDVDMEKNLYEFKIDIISKMMNISLSLIKTKKGENLEKILFIITRILQKLVLDKKYEIFAKLIIDNKTNFDYLIKYLLEYDYETYPNDIRYISDILNYLFKVDKNSNEEFNIYSYNLINIDDIMNNLISKASISKEKYTSKIIKVFYYLVKNENYLKEILKNFKFELFEIIFKYINSPNYEVRQKILKITEILVLKRDIKLTNLLLKKNLLEYIKLAIDPATTCANNAKSILSSLNIIDNYLSMGEMLVKLNGINPTLVSFENIGGKELLERLSQSPNETIENKASYLINLYFKISELD